MANNRKAAIKRLKNLVFTPKSEIGKFRQNIEKQQDNLEELEDILKNF